MTRRGGKKQLDFPAVAVDGGDGQGGQFELVGEEAELAVALLIVVDDQAQEVGARLSGLVGGEADELVGAYAVLAGMRGNRALLDDLVGGVGFGPRHEVDALLRPALEQRVVVVAAVHSHNAVCRQVQHPGNLYVADLAVGDQSKGGKVAVVVEQAVQLHRSLGLAKLSPREEAQAQVDGAAVQAQQLVAKLEFALLAGTRVGEIAAKDIAQAPEQFVRSAAVGVAQRAPRRRFGQSQVVQFAQTDFQAAADLAQALGLGQLAEQHGRQLVPTAKALGMTLSISLLHQTGKGRFRNQL